MIVRLRLFATAREAAGRGSDDYDVTSGATVDTLMAAATARYGSEFESVLGTARLWVNGEEPEQGGATPLHAGDEVAVIPPVSGGAR